MLVNAVSSIGNVNFNGTKMKSVKPTTKGENLSLSIDASNALKAQVLYQRPKNSPEYLGSSLDKKDIIKTLKDNDKMGRSFFGYKNRIVNIIKKANNKKLVINNFNILMDAEYKNGKKLNAADITDILMIATSINNKKSKNKATNEYGYNGGLLDDKSINSIYNIIVKQREQQQFAIMQQHILHQQMMQNEQMQLQMMMTTPGMGFC